MKLWKGQAVVLGVLALITLPGAANAMSPQAEVDIGRMLAREYKQENPVSPDKALQERVNRIGSALVRQLAATMYPYEFTVVARPEINARAICGGFLFFNEGLVALFPDDNALAYVVGHELMHAAHRHIARTSEKMSTVDLFAGLASLALKDRNAYIASAIHNLTLMHYSREDEYDADSSGVELTWRAGYDPRGAVAALTVMAGLDKGDTTPRYLRSHPRTATRLRKAEDLCSGLASRQRPVSSAIDTTPNLQTAIDATVGRLPNAEIGTNRYLPLSVGNQWTYSVSGMGGTVSRTDRVAAEVPTASGTVYRLDSSFAGKSVPYLVLATARDVWRRSKPDDSGSVWKLELVTEASEGQPVTREGCTFSLVGREDISLPCGAFRQCLRIRCEGEGLSSASEVWLAEGVGVVKRTYTGSGVVETLLRYRLSGSNEQKVVESATSPPPAAP